jgi:hypothetical protein
MPARSMAASNTASSPAYAPVCEAAAAWPAAEQPALTTITGFLRASVRAVNTKLRAASTHLDAKQDGARLGIAAQEVQQVVEVEICVFAGRDKVGKTEVARAGSVEHGGDQRARLRNESQLAAPGAFVREAGVESGMG